MSERVLAKMAYRAEPEGVIAVVEAPRLRAAARAGRLYLVAVGIEKPGNLGAIARSAEAAGADALLVAEARADPFNPNAIRASTGAVFTLPIVEATLEQVRRARRRARGRRRRRADSPYTRGRPDALRSRSWSAPRTRASPARWREAADSARLDPDRAPASVDSLNAADAAGDPALRGGAAAWLAATTSLRARPVVERLPARGRRSSPRARSAPGLKCELFQRTGSFKSRGAINKLSEPRRGRAGARRDRDLGRQPRPGGRLRRGRATASTRWW